MTSPRFFQLILPRYSSLVPPVYVRAVSTWTRQPILAEPELRKKAHLVMTVRLEDVEDRLDVLEVVHTSTWRCRGVHLAMQVKDGILTFFTLLPKGHRALRISGSCALYAP